MTCMRRNTDSAVPLKLRPKPPLLRALMRRTHPAFTGSSRAEIQLWTLPRYFHRQPLSDVDKALLTAPPRGTRSSPFWYPIRVNIAHPAPDFNPQIKTFAARNPCRKEDSAFLGANASHVPLYCSQIHRKILMIGIPPMKLREEIPGPP